MLIKCRADSLVDGLRNRAPHLAEPRLLYGLVVGIVRANAGLQVVSGVGDRGFERDRDLL